MKSRYILIVVLVGQCLPSIFGTTKLYYHYWGHANFNSPKIGWWSWLVTMQIWCFLKHYFFLNLFIPIVKVFSSYREMEFDNSLANLTFASGVFTIVPLNFG